MEGRGVSTHHINFLSEWNHSRVHPNGSPHQKSNLYPFGKSPDAEELHTTKRDHEQIHTFICLMENGDKERVIEVYSRTRNIRDTLRILGKSPKTKEQVVYQKKKTFKQKKKSYYKHKKNWRRR